jgi:hypothetical protein
MEHDKNISSDRLEKIKKMHELLKPFISSLEDMAFSKEEKSGKPVDFHKIELFSILSIDSSSIIMSHCIENIISPMEDKEGQEDIIAGILKQLEESIRIRLKDESKSIN